MYKFEISADSPLELRQKMMEFANEMKLSEVLPSVPEYVDDDIDDENIAFPQPIAPVYVPEDLSGMKHFQGAEVDSAGVAWDKNIHSSSKAKNKNGTWRAIRKFETTPKITDAPNAFVVPPPPVTMIPQDASPLVAVPPVAASAQVVNNYDNIQTPPGMRPAHSLITFKNSLPMLFVQLINEKKITREYVEQLKQYFGVKEIWNVLGNELQCIELFNTFAQIGLITKVEQ